MYANDRLSHGVAFVNFGYASKIERRDAETQSFDYQMIIQNKLLAYFCPTTYFWSLDKLVGMNYKIGLDYTDCHRNIIQ